MRKDPRFKGALWLGLTVITAALLFTACSWLFDTNYDPMIPEGMRNTWVSTYGEAYILSAYEFTSTFLDYTALANGEIEYDNTWAYGGDVVNVRQEGNAGYITIRYTLHSNPSYIGNYYVIRWENQTNNSLDIKACSDGAGKEFQQEAENEYTVSNPANYFNQFPASSLITLAAYKAQNGIK
jgi:hypothetical protein